MLKRKARAAETAVQPEAAEATARDVPQEYRKPRADIFTLLLFVALAMLVVATAALWMVMGDYDYKMKGSLSRQWHRPAAGAMLEAPRTA